MSRLVARVLLVAIAAAALSSTACLDDVVTEHGSGDLETRAYEVGEFTSLEAHRALTVEVMVDPDADPSVSVTLDDNLFEFLQVGTSADALVVDASRNLSPSEDALIEVVTNSLGEVAASGASNVSVLDAVEAGDMTLRAGGASRIHLAELRAGALQAEASGASRITVDSGTAEALEGEVSGASVFDLEGLDIGGDVDLDLSGASHADVRTTGDVDGSASGASSIVVHGEPLSVDVSTSGASSVSVRE